MKTAAVYALKMLLVVLLVCLVMIPILALVSCAAAAPAPEKPGTLRVLDHACDARGGVAWLRVTVDGPTISTIEWDNKDACGDPT